MILTLVAQIDVFYLMGDVWVKGSKYYCEHCRIHVHDNPVSRKNHESSTKHTKAVQNQLRNVLKKQEIQKREEAKNRQLLGKIESAALRAHKSRDLPGAVSDGLVRNNFEASKKMPSKVNLALYGYGSGYQEKEDRTYHPSAPIWTPPSNFAEQSTSDMVGPWTVVEHKIDESSSVQALQAGKQSINNKTTVEDEALDEDHSGDKLKEFKLVEKAIKVDNPADSQNSAEEIVFKKRKFSAQGNQRKSRRK